jgi:leader peptidase (prepilin peptidase)/N-methyltransferase
MTMYALLTLGGLIAGWLVSLWAWRLATYEIETEQDAAKPSAASMARAARPTWLRCTPVVLAIAFPAFTWLLLEAGCQQVAEVQPSRPLWMNRLPFQLLLLTLLTAATLTDLIDYVIPDQIVLPGAAAALLWATLSGELQIIHVYVDWSDELVALQGPYLPEWMKHSQHWHGLAWSLAGMLTGAGLLFLARATAHRVLRMPAIGLGDVTLMAMVGAFLGWQPTVCVLGITPLVSLMAGLGEFLMVGRRYVAFGPSLCLASVIVLCSWRWLWVDLGLRLIFSHWPTVISLIAGTLVLFAMLLAGLRYFLSIEPRRLK